LENAGSSVELKYALLTFGIDCGTALEAGGHTGSESQEALVRKYMNHRLEIERADKEAEAREEAKSGVILCPKPNDVLMGRGRPFRDFHGNQRWGQLIEDQVERYRNCPDKFGKTCISLQVVKSVQEYGGRFIQQAGEGWKLLDDTVARDKTLRGFRPRIMKSTDTAGSGALGEGRAKRMKYDPTVSG
jgi:hypothetical protein